MIKIKDIEAYDIKECSEILHVHPQTIRNYLKQGRLNCIRVGRKNYISVETIERFLEVGVVDE